jgi:2'-5' RNA ligase
MIGDQRARLFVALELPENVRTTLARWRPFVPALRLIDASDLHVTLCFLGWRFEHEIQPILDACAVVSGFDVASLSLEEALWLPPRRPRVLAVRLLDAGGRLAEVQAELSGVLSRGGWYAPEARPFLAHVTVARVARGACAVAGPGVRGNASDAVSLAAERARGAVRGLGERGAGVWGAGAGSGRFGGGGAAVPRGAGAGLRPGRDGRRG